MKAFRQAGKTHQMETGLAFCFPDFLCQRNLNPALGTWYLYSPVGAASVFLPEFQHCHPTQALLTKQVFPVGASGKETACNAGDVREAGSIPGLERSSGGGHSTLLQYSCPENPINRGAWWAMVHRVAKSRTRLRRLSRHAHTLCQA